MDHLGDRTKYLGASEAAAAIGLSPWSTPQEVWSEKVLGVEKPHKDIFDRGHIMEGVILDMAEEQLGIKIKDRQREFSTPERPWLRSHVDGIAEAINGDLLIVEVKAPGSRMIESYKEHGLTMPNIVQMQVNLHNSGMKRGLWLILDYDNWELLSFEMERDDAVIAQLLPKLGAFWQSVEAGTEPPHQQPPDVRVEEPEGTKVLVDHDAEVIAERVILARREKKEAEKRLKEAMAQLETLTGDSATTIIGDLLRVKRSMVAGRRSIRDTILPYARSLRDAVLRGDLQEAGRLAQVDIDATFIKDGAPYVRTTVTPIGDGKSLEER